VTETGQKCLLTLRMAASEASVTWGAAVTDLQQPGLAPPLLLFIRFRPDPRPHPATAPPLISLGDALM
jgi:hypothetical protein